MLFRSDLVEELLDTPVDVIDLTLDQLDGLLADLDSGLVGPGIFGAFAQLSSSSRANSAIYTTIYYLQGQLLEYSTL